MRLCEGRRLSALGLTHVWKLKKAHAVNSRARCVLLFLCAGVDLKRLIFLAIDTACLMKTSPILSTLIQQADAPNRYTCDRLQLRTWPLYSPMP